MSNDLISREVLMEGRVENDSVRIAAMCAPTAYDVDAVCEELELLKRKLSNCDAPEIECFTTDCTDCALEKAIEIVRNGGKKE